MELPDIVLNAGESKLGWACGCSRRGAAHMVAGERCQDAFAVYAGSIGASPCLALAVADGHGGRDYDRSVCGASLAVWAAVDQLLTFFASTTGYTSSSVLKGDFQAYFPRQVTRRWRDLVGMDARAQKGASSPADVGEDTFRRYGTTLNAALVTTEALYLGQIGDGDLLLLRPDGTIEVPIVSDTTLIGSETWSLSSPDAHLRWQTATIDRGEGGLLILATDGLSDSFGGGGDEEFHLFARSLMERIDEFGSARVSAAIPEWLDSYSRQGSGDDMTIVISAIPPHPGSGQAGGDGDGGGAGA